VAKGVPLLVVRSIAPGTTDLELRVPPPAGTARVEFRAQLLDADFTGSFALRHEELGLLIPVAGRLEEAGSISHFVADSVPAGRCWLVLPGGHERHGPFEVGPGGNLDLGTIHVPSPAFAALHRLASTPRRLTFDLPPGELHRSRLTVDIFDRADRHVRRFGINPGPYGWSTTIELPLGTYRLHAATASGLVADVRIVIDDLEPSPYTTRIALERVGGGPAAAAAPVLADDARSPRIRRD
jgi:hypothetical protein